MGWLPHTAQYTAEYLDAEECYNKIQTDYFKSERQQYTLIALT